MESELHELCNDGDVEGLRKFLRNCDSGFDFNQYEVIPLFFLSFYQSNSFLCITECM